MERKAKSNLLRLANRSPESFEPSIPILAMNLTLVIVKFKT